MSCRGREENSWVLGWVWGTWPSLSRESGPQMQGEVGSCSSEGWLSGRWFPDKPHFVLVARTPTHTSPGRRRWSIPGCPHRLLLWKSPPLWPPQPHAGQRPVCPSCCVLDGKQNRGPFLNGCSSVSSSFLKKIFFILIRRQFFSLLLEREGREKERERDLNAREKHRSVASCTHPG